MLETPAGQLPFPPSRRLFRAFNGRRVPSPTRRLLEGWESRPRVLVFVTPRAFMPPAWRLPKSQRKRAPSRMPRAAAVSILHVINQVFHAINSSGVFQCAHRIIVTVVIGNI